MTVTSITEIRAELNEMWQRIIAIEKRLTVQPAATGPTQVIPEDCCKKGKYVGQKLAAIVEKDPQYVDWLERNNFALGIGFTTKHVDRARSLLADPNCD